VQQTAQQTEHLTNDTPARHPAKAGDGTTRGSQAIEAGGAPASPLCMRTPRPKRAIAGLRRKVLLSRDKHPYNSPAVRGFVDPRGDAERQTAL